MKKIKKIFAGSRQRLLLLYYFIFHRDVRKRTSLKEMMFHLFSPTMFAIAARDAELLKEDDKYKYYRLSGYGDVFIYPRTAPLYSLAMVLSEARPGHWHYYEAPGTEILPDDVVVDCGCAEGLFAFRHQYTAAHIYALEPLPVFIDSLQQLFHANSRITILPVAAGDTCGKAYMQLPSSETSLNASVSQDKGNDGSIEVDIATLDSLFADKNIRINYIKADIEGFEEYLIRGALETIRMSRPKIAITTYHEGQDYKKLISLVKSVVPEYQYRIKGIDFLSGRPVMLHMWV
ncbi:MAG TPA: FkbM family methyltransferase [Chitinophaga sp.]|uniref:FkbM family methyltransferase n=1 Tax=Chitinophaga sp. TaxID=1869181 RepID=UPI002CB88EAB|nr:FkbM family methyltransferase [Chitinophaga sp.]HVI44786.1 FkbM family methyltransferase [Chitinophaga sp.]